MTLHRLGRCPFTRTNETRALHDMKARKPTMSDPYERLMKMVEIASSGCWVFKGNLQKKGYGKIKVKGKDGKYRQDGVHRVVYRKFYGDIPEGMHVCHHCDNPPCCNPKHLFIGSNRDNMMDRKNKGRTFISFGELSGHCKLSTEQVTSIRSDPRGPSELAVVYGVSKSTISEIKNKTSRKHE